MGWNLITISSWVPPLARGYTHHARGHAPGTRGSPARAGIHPRRMDGRRGRLRFPRSRGDTPGRTSSPIRGTPVPPLARGYTRVEEAGLRRAGGSPARAGIHPGRGACAEDPSRFPRSRGDTPRSCCSTTRTASVPPLARGYTSVPRVFAARVDGSPARAGIHPQPHAGSDQEEGFPRSRGDTPVVGLSDDSDAMVPPLARGYTPGNPQPPDGGGGSPARAGIHPRSARAPTTSCWFPRSRGDTPIWRG